jgi:hypothetical protein
MGGHLDQRRRGGTAREAGCRLCNVVERVGASAPYG